MKNYSAIDIFNDWAKSGRDKGMEEGHNDSGSKIVQIVKDLKNNDFEQNLSILDIGCGNGWLLRKITANYKNSSGLGVDGSLDMINNASTIDKMNQYTVADLNYWTPENKFDIVGAVTKSPFFPPVRTLPGTHSPFTSFPILFLHIKYRDYNDFSC